MVSLPLLPRSREDGKWPHHLVGTATPTRLKHSYWVIVSVRPLLAPHQVQAAPPLERGQGTVPLGRDSSCQPGGPIRAPPQPSLSSQLLLQPHTFILWSAARWRCWPQRACPAQPPRPPARGPARAAHPPYLSSDQPKGSARGTLPLQQLKGRLKCHLLLEAGSHCCSSSFPSRHPLPIPRALLSAEPELCVHKASLSLGRCSVGSS